MCHCQKCSHHSALVTSQVDLVRQNVLSAAWCLVQAGAEEPLRYLICNWCKPEPEEPLKVSNLQFAHSMSRSTTTTEYLQREVDPVLRPILAALARQRPRGSTSILRAIADAANAAVAFPSTPAEVTACFLGRVFGAEVLGFEVDDSKVADGVLGDAFRIHSIRYAAGAEKPSSCYLKVAKSIPDVVDLCLSSGAYAKEVFFFGRYQIH